MSTRIKKRVTNFLLLLISSGSSLVALEFGLRWFYPQNLSLSYQTRDRLKILRPSHRGIFRGVETTLAYQTNSCGMRDREHALEKPAGSFRVLVLGDSFMEALQVRYEQSFPRILESNLNEQAIQPVEVINAAVSGWGTDDQLTFVRRVGAQWKPDLVLVGLTLANDVNDNLNERFHLLVNDKLQARPVSQLSSLQYGLWQAKAYLASHSHLYQILRLGWHYKKMEAEGLQLASHMMDQLSEKPNPRLEKGWKLTFELLKEMDAASQNIGGKLAVFLIPMSIQVDPQSNEVLAKKHHYSWDSFRLERPQRLMQEFGEKYGVEVIDLLPSFLRCQNREGHLLVLKQDGHWTEKGHTVAATVVSNALLERSLIKGHQTGEAPPGRDAPSSNAPCPPL